MRELKFRGKVEGNWWYVRVSDDHTSGSWEQFWSLVDKSTVGQYIGKKDKAGKEIYEGDIVRGYRDDTWYPFQIKSIADGGLLSSFDYNHREITGNVYDNPELVKG